MNEERGFGKKPPLWWPVNPGPARSTPVEDGESDGPEDLCDRDFTAAAPGVELVGGITDVRTWAGWAHMATVIDCYSKMIIGWAIADHMRESMDCTGVGTTQWLNHSLLH